MTVQGTSGEPTDFASLTPRKVVEELDKYIVGQDEAKKAVAIALRNRWRRQNVDPELRDEILPNNIIMIGPTGVGKTEIARRLSRLAGAPFIKVEASKFTEVGYVGRDVESMVRDLVDISVNIVRGEREDEFREVAADRVEERLLDLLLPPLADRESSDDESGGHTAETDASRTFVVGTEGEAHLEGTEGEESLEGRRRRTREKLRDLLKAEKLEDREVEVEVSESALPTVDVGTMGMDGMDFNLGEMLQDMLPKRTRRRLVTVAEARRILLSEETDKLIDMDEVVEEAVARAENMGIIFLDELDKVAGSRRDHGPDVSREGVQRDLLPIVEGSTVGTKYGSVKTDHILFIAAGAFHVSKVADLIPELQGRFPIRVELDSLEKEDFIRILTEPQNALTKQYQALMATEGIEVIFERDAVEELAGYAAEANRRAENIGARRLYTIMEALLEELSYDASERAESKFIVNVAYVKSTLDPILADEDLAKYIL